MLLHIKGAQCPKSSILTIIKAENSKTIALLEIKAIIDLFHCPSHGHTHSHTGFRLDEEWLLHLAVLIILIDSLGACAVFTPGQ